MEDILPRPMVLEEFHPLVGKQFRLDCAPNDVDVTLVSAAPTTVGDAHERPPFTLIFQSDYDVQLSTGLYAMRSQDFGPDLIYIEEMSPPADMPLGHYYQAVFE